jgi:hypothetical protein
MKARDSLALVLMSGISLIAGCGTSDYSVKIPAARVP